MKDAAVTVVAVFHKKRSTFMAPRRIAKKHRSKRLIHAPAAVAAASPGAPKGLNSTIFKPTLIATAASAISVGVLVSPCAWRGLRFGAGSWRAVRA
jgi:hypothetical protein